MMQFEVGRCVCCQKAKATDEAHWPIAKGMGGRSKAEDAKLPRLPLCHECHMAEHKYVNVRERLIEVAPEYWRWVGKWDENREVFETWLSGLRLKQQFMEAQKARTI